MEDLVRLVLSALFGLLPLWIIILRARNRRQQRQALARSDTTNNAKAQQQSAASDTTEWDESENDGLLETDSIWGAQYFTPRHSRIPVEREEEQQTEQEDRIAEEEQHETVLSHFDQLEQTTPPTEDHNSFNGQNEVKIHLNKLGVDELRRAIILSEILSPPRSMRPLQE